jgi:hypothetical protein
VLASFRSKSANFEARRLEPTAFFALGLLFCFAVRYSTLDHNFWEQELVAAAAAELDWASLFHDRLVAGEPPLYYALLKALGLAGASEFAFRVPSAILDSLGCGLFALVARKSSGRVGGVALVLAFSFMPVLIRFGQEARPYPLLCFFFALAIAAATVIWRAPRQTLRATKAGPSWRHRAFIRLAIAALVIGMVGAGWTMVIGWAAVLALQVSALAWPPLWRVKGMARLWLMLCGVTWLGIAPCIVGVAPNLGHFAAILWTADPYPTTINTVAADLRGIYGWVADGDLNHFFPGGAETWLGIALLALALVSAFRRAPRPPIHQVTFIAVVFPVVLFGMDFFRSLVALRHIHPSLWCLCLLYADGAATIVRRWPGRLAVAVLAVCVVLQGIDGAEAERKASWEPFLRFFRTNQLETMKGYVTDAALGVLIERSLPAGSHAAAIEVDETPAALRSALARALSADAPVWILTARPLGNVLGDLPAGVASCAGTISYHAFVVVARSFDLLPPQIRDCASATPSGT